MQPKKRILVARLSALGDVVLTIPVLENLVSNNPDYEFVFLSQGFANRLMKDVPGIRFFKADIRGKHKGVLGLWRLSRELKELGNWYAFADLHDVIRTKILRIFLYFSIPRQAVIDKGRKDKHALTRKNNKIFKQLDHTLNRYFLVFKKLPLNVKDEVFRVVGNPIQLGRSEIAVTGKKNGTWIGVAPFAKHRGKVYPSDKMGEVIDKLSKNDNLKILLFGGGNEEVDELVKWSERYPNTISVAGKIGMEGELRIMSNLDVMISMDSANMHLASLAGVNVISIWGATHPFAGFYGYNQPQENAVQVNNLNCRPCSVFGNKPCFRKDYACMNQIEPDVVYQKVMEVLGQNV